MIRRLACETQTHSVSLDEDRLLRGERRPPLPGEKPALEPLLPFAPVTVALEVSPGKADLFEWTRESPIRRDGVTGKVVWDALQSTRTIDRAREPDDWLLALSRVLATVTILPFRTAAFEPLHREGVLDPTPTARILRVAPRQRPNRTEGETATLPDHSAPLKTVTPV